MATAVAPAPPTTTVPTTRATPPTALLSAHRCAAAQHGLPDNSREALEAALATSVDFVEFDVNRTADGVLVLHHDTAVRTPAGVRPLATVTYDELSGWLGRRPVVYDDALRLIAASDKRAHVDLKLTSERYDDPLATHEAHAAERALQLLGGDEAFVVTSTEDASVAAVRAWSGVRGVRPLAGLSLGSAVRPQRPRRVDIRFSDVSPGDRFERCGANLVVANRRLADLCLLRWAERRGLPVLVWTVDDSRSLQRYRSDRRVGMVTTNHPARARPSTGRDVIRPAPRGVQVV